MQFGPKRGHPVYLFENLIGDFLPMIIVLIISAVRGDLDLLLNNAFVIVVVVAAPFRRLITYLTTLYCVQDDMLTVTSGWLNKTRQEVPLSTITTVDITESILHQLTGTVKLNVDNTSNVSAVVTKISMTFRKADAFRLRSVLLSGAAAIDGANLVSEGMESAAAPAGAVRIPARQLLLMGALRSKGAFFFQLVALLFAAIGFLGDLFTEVSTKAEETTGTFLLWIQAHTVSSTFVLLAAILLLAYLCGSLGALIRYYGFQILDGGDAIRIEYGLLRKKSFTIHKSRISGFSYEQSLLMRLFGFGLLHCLAIGYGTAGGDDETTEEPLLFPFLREANLTAVMGQILPEMSSIPVYEHSTGASMRYFFYRPAFVISFLLFAGSIALSFLYGVRAIILGVLLLLYGCGSILLQHRNAALAADGTLMSVAEGGYKKMTVFVKTRHVESVSETASLFKRRKGICSVQIQFIAPAGASAATARNLSRQCFEKVRGLLIY